MKKILSYILTIVTLVWLPLAFANAVNCQPPFKGNYTVEATCTWPGNYKVFWNIIVWNKVVTVPTGVVMGINLTNRKITFTTGKILLQWTAKIDNSVSTRYYTTHAYTASSGVTNCPAGYQVLNNANGTPTNYQWATQTTGLAASWNFYCWK